MLTVIMFHTTFAEERSWASSGVDDLENLKGTHLDKADQGELLGAQTECTFIFSDDEGHPCGVVMSFFEQDGVFWLTAVEGRHQVKGLDRGPALLDRRLQRRQRAARPPDAVGPRGGHRPPRRRDQAVVPRPVHDPPAAGGPGRLAQAARQPQAGGLRGAASRRSWPATTSARSPATAAGWRADLAHAPHGRPQQRQAGAGGGVQPLVRRAHARDDQQAAGLRVGAAVRAGAAAGGAREPVPLPGRLRGGRRDARRTSSAPTSSSGGSGRSGPRRWPPGATPVVSVSDTLDPEHFLVGFFSALTDKSALRPRRARA